ncbi:MAG: quaternary ammonium compound-resistance protein SugE [Gammaproteobacteria bacterium]|nr:MAG: quaternary ammonium compound-resistance protein SugE [Gammaproteobacteria bacterium]
MAWIYLLIAGLFECVWAVGLKYTEGFTRIVPSAITLAAMALSMWFLSLSLKSIPIGTGYAVWTGIGAIGVAIIGMAFLGEPRQIARIICLLLIVSGIIGLKVVS